MCKPKKPPQTPTPAPAPAPALANASVAQSEAASPDEEETLRAVKRRGRNALRIDLAATGAAGGSGLNIPQG